MSCRRGALLSVLILALMLIPSTRGEPQEPPLPAVDASGDALPPGASARLGTLRWRHGSLITASAFAPDGVLVATAGQDGTVYLWESATGKKLRQFKGVQSEVSALTFSPDGKSLSAANRYGGSVRTWETATGKELRQVSGYPGDDCSVAFSEDGEILATGNSKKSSTIRMRETTTGRDLFELKGHQGVIYALAISPDRKLLVSGGDDKILRLWDTSTGKEVHAFAGHAQRIRCTRFSPDGKRIASASDDGTVRVWEVATRKEIHQFAADATGVLTLAFSPDGTTLAAGGRDQVLRLFDAARGKVIRQLHGHHSAILTTAFSPDGKVLVSGGIGGRVRIWDATTGKERFRDGHQAGVHSLYYGPDGKTLFTGGFDNTLRRWDLGARKELRRFDVPEGATCVALSPDGAILATGTRVIREGEKNPGIRLCDTATGKEIRRIPGQTKGVFCLAFSPCGKVLAAGGNEEAPVQLWDVATGRQLRRPKTMEGGVRGLAFSPTGQVLACAGTDGTVRLLEAASSRPRSAYTPMDLSDHFYYTLDAAFRLNGDVPRDSFSWEHPPLVESILFFPDGKTLATAGANDGGGRFRRRIISIWDTTTDKELRWFVGPQRRAAALAAALSADGKILALGSDDGSVQLRDAVTGKELCLFRGHQGSVYALSFAPDGRTLASSSSDATVLIWDVAGALQARRLTSAEVLDKHLNAVWTTLADDDGAKAAKAIWQMTETPQAAVQFLKVRLQPIAPVDAKRITQWVADLDNDRFQVRQQAADVLKDLDQALPTLKETLEDNLSLEMRRRIELILEKLEQSPPPSYLRALRAVEVLEHIGTTEARELLATLSRGASGARLTQAAQQAHQRLAKRTVR